MLLTIDQAKKLSFLDNDKSGKADFVFNQNKPAKKKDIEYAINKHDFLNLYRKKPFIANIDELKKKLKEMEN